MFDITTRDIKYLQGVGPQRATVLNKELNLFSLHDLLYYFPSVSYTHLTLPTILLV